MRNVNDLRELDVTDVWRQLGDDWEFFDYHVPNGTPAVLVIRAKESE